MKTGYSNFLGEYVAAEAVDYGDCQDFQIVCPCCSEPIFKSQRPAAEKEVHYLSHYRSTKSVVSDCENRVSSLSREYLGTTNAASRKQRLDWFMSVVPDEIDRILIPPRFDRRGVIMAATAFSVDFCDGYRRSLGMFKIAKAESHARIWQENDEEMTRSFPSFAALSPLWRRVRSRTARDVETTLYVDPSAGQAFRKIFCSAVNMMMLRCSAKAASKQASPLEFGVLNFFRELVVKDYVEARIHMDRTFRAETPEMDGGGEPMSVGDAIVRWVDREIHDALCRVDYVDLMRRRLETDSRSTIEKPFDSEFEETPAFGM